MGLFPDTESLSPHRASDRARPDQWPFGAGPRGRLGTARAHRAHRRSLARPRAFSGDQDGRHRERDRAHTRWAYRVCGHRFADLGQRAALVRCAGAESLFRQVRLPLAARWLDPDSRFVGSGQYRDDRGSRAQRHRVGWREIWRQGALASPHRGAVRECFRGDRIEAEAARKAALLVRRICAAPHREKSQPSAQPAQLGRGI